MTNDATALDYRLGRSTRSYWRIASSNLVRFCRRKPLGALGALVLLTVCLVAVFAPLLAPHDPLQSVPGARLASPSGTYLMGTDAQSRDVFSRVIYGARLSLKVSLASVALATLSGCVIGVVSGYFGGWIDFLIQRVIDVMLSIPVLILAVALVAMLGQSVPNLIAAIAIGQMPSVVRVVRSAVLQAREQQYVSAAQVVGATDIRIMFRHVLPNVVAPVIILASAGLGFAILAETSLSFLGLGPPITEPSWGQMLSGQARTYMTVAPWLGIFPGIAISVVVFGANMLGDALRDEWDPRLRSR